MAAILPFRAYADPSDTSSIDSWPVSGSESEFEGGPDEYSLDDGNFGGDNASELDLNDAYFSPATFPASEPSTHGRTFLRGQQTAYANLPASSNTLAPHARPTACNDARDQHGRMPDDREVVGVFVDAQGNVVAEQVENLPPPPDRNYSHTREGNRHMLKRAMGYDPDVYHRKAEVYKELNPAENINGDAQLSAVRIAEATEHHERDTFMRRDHTQAFAATDTGRDDYDGYNPKRSGPERVRATLEHSWRETLSAPQAPPNPTLTQGSKATSHALHEARREEIAGPFDRRPHAAFVSTSATSHAVHAVNRRELSDTYTRRPVAGVDLGNAEIPVVSATAAREFEGRRAAGHGIHGDVPIHAKSSTTLRSPEAALPGGRAHATEGIAGAARHAQPRVTPGDREASGSARPTDVAALAGGLAAPRAHERHGGDSISARRAVTTTVDGLGSSVGARGAQRAGGESTALHRAVDADGGGSGGAHGTAAGPVRGAHAVRPLTADSTRAHTATRGHTVVQEAARAEAVHRTGHSDSTQGHGATRGEVVEQDARRAEAVHRVSGTDARAVHAQTFDAHSEGFAAHTASTDVAMPLRASHSTAVPVRVEGAHTLGAGVMHLGEQRLPTDDTATWRFGGVEGAGASAANVPHAVDNLADDRATDIGWEGSRGATSHEVAAPTHSHAPLRATAGAMFGPDRLSASRSSSHRRMDQRIGGQVSLSEDRSTPIRALLGEDAHLNESRAPIDRIGEVRLSGSDGSRETHVRDPATSSMMLRG